LKLNAGFFPLGTSQWEDVIVDIFSGAVCPVDIIYAEQEDGTLDISQIEFRRAVSARTY
jgi:hypothetical protein